MASIDIVEVLDEMRALLNKNYEDILRDYTINLNESFGNTLLPDASNAGENLSIELNDHAIKTLRTFEAISNALGSLEAKINTFNELSIVYGRQSLGGASSYLLSTFAGDLLDIKFYFGFLAPTPTSLPRGVTATFNPTTLEFDFIVEKNLLENDNTFFSVNALNYSTIKIFLKIRPDLPQPEGKDAEGNPIPREDVENPNPLSPLDVFYTSFLKELHSLMPIARLYEGDITRDISEPVNNQLVKYKWSIAVGVSLTFRVQFVFDPQEGHNIDTRQEIVEAFKRIISRNQYGTIAKNINLQDFGSLANVKGVALARIGWDSSDTSLVPNQALTDASTIISIPSNVYLDCGLIRNNVENAPS